MFVIQYTQLDWKGIMLNDEVEIGTAFIVTTDTQKSVEQMLLQFLLFILSKKIKASWSTRVVASLHPCHFYGNMQNWIFTLHSFVYFNGLHKGMW